MPEHQNRLERVIVEAGEGQIEVARRLPEKTHSQQTYSKIFNLSPSRNLDFADAGSPDYQGYLAAEILIRSTQEDRCVEALKWLILANHIRQMTDPERQYAHFGSVLEFLMFGMAKEQVDKAYSLAENWLDQKFDGQTEIDEIVPEFSEYMARCRQK